MKISHVLPALIFATSSLGMAQEQEQNMLERIQNPTMEANRMHNKTFQGGTGIQVREFQTGAFTGNKSATTKEFTTRSFLGMRNPWFGEKVYDSRAASIANRSALEASNTFTTASFAVDANSSANRSADISATLTDSMKPREAAIPSTAQGSVDQFTQNLDRDLSIDDVRKLLNKGQQSR